MKLLGWRQLPPLPLMTCSTAPLIDSKKLALIKSGLPRWLLWCRAWAIRYTKLCPQASTDLTYQIFCSSLLLFFSWTCVQALKIQREWHSANCCIVQTTLMEMWMVVSVLGLLTSINICLPETPCRWVIDSSCGKCFYPEWLIQVMHFISYAFPGKQTHDLNVVSRDKNTLVLNSLNHNVSATE